MKQAIWILAALVLAAAGCSSTVVVNPLHHELSYQFTPAPDMEKSIDKSIAIVPFEDGRMYDGKNRTVSTSELLNLVPVFVFYTTGHDSHPEVTYSSSVGGIFSRVKAVGNMANAFPKVLADYLHRSRRFSKAVFVEAAEVKGRHSYDYVLRGTLVESKLTTTRFSYGLGPLATAAHLLGAPMVKFSASLTVDWQLYDANDKPVGPKQKVTLDAPITQHTGLYYGLTRENKDVPFGLYVACVKQVNAKIADGISELITR